MGGRAVLVTTFTMVPSLEMVWYGVVSLIYTNGGGGVGLGYCPGLLALCAG